MVRHICNVVYFWITSRYMVERMNIISTSKGCNWKTRRKQTVKWTATFTSWQLLGINWNLLTEISGSGTPYRKSGMLNRPYQPLPEAAVTKEESPVVSISQRIGIQTVYGTEPHPLPRSGSRAARVTLKIIDKHNRLNYCLIFTVYA